MDAAEPSPRPEDVLNKKRSPSVVQPGPGDSSDKKEPDGSFGRGTREGNNKRAKGEPALRLDRESSTDPLAHISKGSDRLMDFLHAQAEADKTVMAEIAKAQVMSMQAERLKQATAAAEMFVKAQKEGVELPPGLMAMFNGS